MSQVSQNRMQVAWLSVFCSSLICFAGLILYWIRFDTFSVQRPYQWALLLGTGCSLILFYLWGRYASLSTIKKTWILAWLTTVVILSFLAFVTKTGVEFSRLWFIAWVMSGGILVWLVQISRLGFDPVFNQLLQQGLDDFTETFNRTRFWFYLGWMDIRMRYRGSALGPLWISASMLIFISALGAIYSHLFHQRVETYIPFLTCGYLVWNFISASLIESCDMFAAARGFIHQIKLPFLIYPFRVTWRNLIVFFHNALVYVIVCLYFKIIPNWHLILFIPAILLIAINLVWLVLLIGMLGTRFRDIPPVVNSIIQVIFFISPVTWMPNLIGGNEAWIVKLNPVSYFLDLVRDPLLGTMPHGSTWLVCFALTLIGWLITFPVFVLTRRRIPFWL